MRLTVERVLDAQATAVLYELYVAAFAPMRMRAAARHLLTAEEFAAELVDERIDKYVAWSDGKPVALTTLTTDLTAVAWISPEYFAFRYPDQFSRGAVFYLGYTLVHPDHENQGVFTLMTEPLVRRLQAVNGVCAFDVCGYNDRRTVGRFVAALPGSSTATVEAVDTQTYYAASFGPPSATSGAESQATSGEPVPAGAAR